MAVLVDLYSRQVVDWAMSTANVVHGADTWWMAWQRRRPAPGLVHHRQFQNQAEARYTIAEYIEVFYNRQRLHQALGYRSPEEFEREKRDA